MIKRELYDTLVLLYYEILYILITGVYILLNTFQIYEIVSPTHGLEDHWQECFEMKRYHVPALLTIIGNFKNY